MVSFLNVTVEKERDHFEADRDKEEAKLLAYKTGLARRASAGAAGGARPGHRMTWRHRSAVGRNDMMRKGVWTSFLQSIFDIVFREV